MAASRSALVLTRPRAASERFWSSLSPATRGKLDLVLSPVLRIEPIVGKVDVGAARGLILTSAHAVDAARTVSQGLPCFCVGLATTQAAQEAGLNARAMGQDADSLIATLLSDRPDAPLLHLRGRHARGDVAARLSDGGLPCAEQVVYDQPAVALSDRARAALTGRAILPVFSPRSAALIADQMPGTAKPWIVALSTAVADPFSGLPPGHVHVCAQPDADEMRHLVEKLVNHGIRVEGGGTPH